MRSALLLTPSKIDALAKSDALTPRLMRVPEVARFCPQAPTPKQIAALLCTGSLELFFGGAGGPGKSSFLLMDALQYVDHADYKAIIIRRTYKDLALPEAIMARAKEWWIPRGVAWNEQDKTFTFPSGAVIVFGYMENSSDKYRYGSAAFHSIAVDELAQFPDEADPIFLFSRLRRAEGSPIPLRFRAASNPVGPGVSWIKRRFIDGRNPPARVFLPALLADNPHIDAEGYRRSLANLDPITRERILHGNWEIADGGTLFERSWFRIVESFEGQGIIGDCRAWDLAASTTGKRTAGVRLIRLTGGLWCIFDCVAGQWAPGERDRVIKQVAEIDGKRVPILFEQEPGSSGVDQQKAMAKMLAGWRVIPIRPTGDKVTRAGPFASQAQAGFVTIMRGRWNGDYLDELHAAPDGPFVDRMDATSLAFNWMAPQAGSATPARLPRERDEDAEDDIRHGFASHRPMNRRRWAGAFVPPPPPEIEEPLDIRDLDSSL